MKLEGRENIPKDEKFIAVANHVSMYDPLFVSQALRMPMAYMGKKELFEPSFEFNWWVKRLGAFAVDRENPKISTFKTVSEILKTNWGLGMFPEGHINKVGKIRRVPKGFITLAKRTKTNLLPIAICGFKSYSGRFHSQDVTIKVGEPISYELPEDEILTKWVDFVCTHSGIKNELKISKNGE